VRRIGLLSEAITVVALLLALAVAGIAQRRNALLRETILQIRMSSTRAQAQDRLIGKKIDTSSLGLGRSATAPPMLLWIIDLDNCAGCFDDVSEWRRLERLEDHDLALLLVGKPDRSVAARLRALRKTVVAQTTRAEVLGSLGNTLPNTKLLLDAEGIAVLVDSRASGQECGWSFDAQVAAIRGLQSARAIRLNEP